MMKSFQGIYHIITGTRYGLPFVNIEISVGGKGEYFKIDPRKVFKRFGKNNHRLHRVLEL